MKLLTLSELPMLTKLSVDRELPILTLEHTLSELP
jgi:hypothetical protein